MFLSPLHLPLISAGYFGGVMQRMLEFVSLRVRRSDQGMTPSLSPGLRAQTVALHRRLLMLASEFHRLAMLAREGRLRVYPDRSSPAARTEAASTRPRAAQRLPPPSPFGSAAGMAQGPTLPALPTRGFGWMLGFVPAAYRDALAGLLRNPEMVALIQASPSVARLLRPLCRSLGVTPPEGVFPARRRRQPRGTPRSQCRARSDGARTDLGGGTEPARAFGREPSILMSPKARDRWWAEHRGAARSAGDATGLGEAIGVGEATRAVRSGAPAQGRCAKS